MCGPLQKSCDYQTASELTDVDCNKFQFLTENRKALLKVKQVKINGISYVPNMVVVTDGTTDLPLFGNINAIFVYNNDDVYFLCDELITVCLKEHYACYEIEMGKKQMLIDYRTLYIVSPAVKTKKRDDLCHIETHFVINCFKLLIKILIYFYYFKLIITFMII